ncbi:MAG: copper-binding protein [Hyphomicrobiaceae bacterium]
MKILIAALCTSVALTLAGQPVLAQSAGHGGHAGHTMATPAVDAETAAPAVVHSVDVAGAKINVTHDPIPSIGWPKMTMDLPVTKSVDLSKVKAGDKVTIVLKLGRDKQYRVVGIKSAP